MKFFFTLVMIGFFSQFASAQRSTIALPWASMRTKKETTTTTLPPVGPGGCTHKWRKFDPTNDPNAPMNDGVPIGPYKDGSPQFVARCVIEGGNVIEAAYINVNGSRKDGSYSMSTAFEYPCLDSTTEYLVDNPDYVYKWDFARPDERFENQVYVDYTPSSSSLTERIPTRVNTTNTNGEAFSAFGMRVTNLTTYYRSPIIWFGCGNTGRAPVEILTCSTKELADRDFKVPAPKGNGLCALEWRRFDGKNLDEVVENGVLAGYFFDKAPIYVGRGAESYTSLAFGRLTVNGSLPPAVYTLDNESEYPDTAISAEYLVRNPAYIYAWVNNPNGEPITNNVNIRVNDLELAFTRFLWNYRAHAPFTVIPWTTFGGQSNYFDPIDGFEYEIERERVEYLVCNTDGSYGAIQDSYDGECVHRWKYFNTQTAAPMIEGVDAGDYIDEIPMFVGKGKQHADVLVPGRAMVNGTPGVYVDSTYDKEDLDQSDTAQYLFYNESQVYEWEKWSISEQRQNIEDVYSGSGKFVAISRVLLTDPSNGKEFHVVGVTIMGQHTQYYNPIKKESIVTKEDVELLICSRREIPDEQP